MRLFSTNILRLAAATSLLLGSMHRLAAQENAFVGDTGSADLPRLNILSANGLAADPGSRSAATAVSVWSAQDGLQWLWYAGETNAPVMVHAGAGSAATAALAKLELNLPGPAHWLQALHVSCASQEGAAEGTDCRQAARFVLTRIDHAGTSQRLNAHAPGARSLQPSTSVTLEWNGEPLGIYSIASADAHAASTNRFRTDSPTGVEPVLAQPASVSTVTAVEALGVAPVSQAIAGLGWNVSMDNEWEFKSAAAAGATHVRFQCGWGAVETQSAPPANTNQGPRFILPANCAQALRWSKTYKLQPTVVAAYGPPFHKILSVLVPTGAPAGSKTLAIQLSSSVGGDDLQSVAYPNDYLMSADGYTELSPLHSYAGTLITGISILDKTHAVLQLASGLSRAIPASSAVVYTINEALYPSAVTSRPEDPSVQAFAEYAAFLARQIGAAGVTGEVEIWNEPPWPDEAWDNRRDLYDSDPHLPGEMSPGFPNWGFVAALQARTDTPAGVTYNWAGTHKSGDNSVLDTNMKATTGVSLQEPSAAIASESLHPYGNNPEDALWNQFCLQSTVASNPASPSSFWACNVIPANGANAAKPEQLTLMARSQGAAFGVRHSITETGFSGVVGDDAHKTRFLMRQFLGFQAADIAFLEFYRLFDTSADDFSFFSTVPDANGVYAPLPVYTALAGLMSDLAPIQNAPVQPYDLSSLGSVTSYAGTYPLDVVRFAGSRAGQNSNSYLISLWQRSYTASNPGWGTLASPPALQVTYTLPQGTRVTSATNLDTRAPVPFQQSGQAVTLAVSDDPVGLLVDPEGASPVSLSGQPDALLLTSNLAVVEASIAYTGNAAPTGSVSFQVDGGQLYPATCFATVSPMDCTATLPAGAVTLDSQRITVSLSADKKYAAADLTSPLEIYQVL